MLEAPKPDISGYLNAKRKLFWSTRYAEIQNTYLFYYKKQGFSYSKGDIQARKTIPLVGSKIQKIIVEKTICITFNEKFEPLSLYVSCIDDREKIRSTLIVCVRGSGGSRFC